LNESILLAGVEKTDNGEFRVLAPLVGTWSDPPSPGALVGAGSRIGLLRHLNRRFALVLPDGAAGRVRGSTPKDRVVAVEFGQELFRLSAAAVKDLAGAGEDVAVLGHPAGAGLAPGTRAVVSPTDGVFYRRSSPGAPPFVEVGTKVRTGDVLGLVEVMKTFNRIAYGGPGLPDEAEIVEIRGHDAEEVRAGDILLVFR
jgi:acetyl-CoA carboxylase biotin carboxyl carrier protein